MQRPGCAVLTLLIFSVSLRADDRNEGERPTVRLAPIVRQAQLAIQGKADPARLREMLESVDATCSELRDKRPTRVSELARVFDQKLQVIEGMANIETVPKGSFVALEAGWIGKAEGCVILASSGVDIHTANNCIIVVGHSLQQCRVSSSLILAGQDICQIQHQAGSNNDVLCGGKIRLYSMSDSLLAANEVLRLDSYLNNILVNYPGEKPPDPRLDPRFDKPERHPKYKHSLAIDLKVPAPDTSLDEEMHVTQVFKGPLGHSVALFRLASGEGEFVARSLEDVRYTDGKPIPALAGWKLVYISLGHYAIFKKEDRYCVLDAKR